MKKTTTKEIAENAKAPRRLQGVVKSDKMKDTIVVEVTRFEKHVKYQKFLKLKKRYKADDKGNTKKIGETVEIEECRPISKDKHFKVIS